MKQIFVFLAMAAICADAHAASPADSKVVDLLCTLTNNPPRTPGHAPDTFTQHVRINFGAGTVNGHKATITDRQIGWEPRPGSLRPYATLSRPGWQYHSTGQNKQVAYTVTGSCVEQ
jgi:hypothetical protein